MRTSLSLRSQGLLCAFVFFSSLALSVRAAAPVAATLVSMELSDSSVPALRLASHKVDAVINGRVARVGVESVYVNSSSRDLEATYVFPLPEGATVEKFVMWMDGQPVEGKVAEKERAKATYQNIVNKQKDPGLVEQLAENLFRFRIYPVKANAEQRVRIEYSQVLPFAADSNSLSFHYPLNNSVPRTGARSASTFVVNVALEMEAPVAALESSTHKISQRILPENPKRGSVSIEEIQSALDRDFALKITLKDRALPVASLAFRPAVVAGKAAEDGTLMLFITPQLPANEEPPAKDVVLVMDTSGSMDGEKILQARKALNECLTRLRPVDRFALISFSDFSKVFSQNWCAVNPETLGKAREFVNALNAAGGTNIGEALERALAFPMENGRVKQILFATDGIPSVGEHDPVKLAQMAVGKDGPPQRVFTFGIGYDVNTVLLDGIAESTHGARAYVRENESIDQKIGSLINKISAPALTDVTVSFSPELGVEQIYPPKTGDLYLGQQMVLTARYKKAGARQVVLKGKRNGKEVVIEAALNLPETSVQATAFVTKQWAMRKTGYLLDQMRLYGGNAELKAEVIRLGTEFGIVTPYTSYLALEAPDRARFDAQTVANGNSGIQIPADILAQAELGDHFETTNLDRPDSRSGFGNPDAHMFHSVTGGGAAPGSGGGWAGGQGTGVGSDVGAGRGSFGNRGGGGRKLMVKRHGGSKATESSVDNALKWLAYHQETDGHWDSKKYGSVEQNDCAVTSLALLALLGAGHSEKVGEYRDNVRRAVTWLKGDGVPNRFDNAKGSTDIGNAQALMAMALAEAAAMANLPETRMVAQRAIDACVASQAASGGWGFTANEEPNMFATTWYIMAMKSAKVAGLHIEHSAFDNAIKFLDTMERKVNGNASTYMFSAKENGDANDATRTAMGALSRQFLGWKKEDLEETVAGFVARGRTPVWSDDVNFTYYYFGTLCAFQQGGDVWKRWNEALKNTLGDNQSKTADDAGSWLAKDSGKALGRAGQTAFGALCLETYYRYAQLSGEAMSPATSGNSNVPPPPSSGKSAVDYSEYIRQLKEGEGK